MKISYVTGLMLTAAVLLTTAPLCARHGSNVLMGGFMGASMGAMLGGNDGVVGLMTGLAVGTAAELIDNSHDHHHCHDVVYTHEVRPCHQIVYTHEVRPSRTWLEDQIDVLEHKLHNAHQEVSQLEYELEKKDCEIHRLQKKINHLESCCRHGSEKTEVIFSAKAVTV